MNLGARIARLERRPDLRPAPERCRECGHGPGVPPRYRLEFGRPERDRPARCVSCGTQLMYAIEFDRAG